MTMQTITLQVPLPQSLVENFEVVAKAEQLSVEDLVAAKLGGLILPVPGLPADLLEELLKMNDYGDSALQEALRPAISLTDDRRLRELTHLSKERELTSPESHELLKLLELSQRSVIRRAQALAILRRRGYSLPADDEEFEDKAVLV